MQRPVYLALAAVLLIGACGGESRSPGADSAAAAVGMPLAQTDAAAPNVYRVRIETTKGPFVVEVHRDWAPRGADRFYHLVQSRALDDVRFFRVVSSFMVQFGMHGTPDVNAAWEDRPIADDSVTQSNRRGYVTFANAGPNTRANQIFINTVNNRPLDEIGFAPFGQVVDGLAVVDSLYADYGDSPPNGGGPIQTRIRAEGNAYLQSEFPRLDFIRTARVVSDSAGAAGGATRDTSAR